MISVLLTTLAAALVCAAPSLKASNGIAFSFSGAGGRISQHAALMSILVNGTYPGGVKLRPSFLAGASSGALSAVMLSAILETQDKKLGANG